VGAAIGTALLGAILVTGLGSITNDLTDLGVPEQAATEVTEVVQQSAGTAVAALPDQPGGDVLFDGASQGFATAAREVGFVAAGLIGLGLIAAFFLPRNAARTEAAGYVE
jgi:hypothetical protein